MGWLYRGAYAMASNWAPDAAANSLGCLGFPIKMLKLLECFDIKAICIFDGWELPGKHETLKKRADDKAKCKALAKEQWESGNTDEAIKW